jgi:hypothetical protein
MQQTELIISLVRNIPFVHFGHPKGGARVMPEHSAGCAESYFTKHISKDPWRSQ